MASFCGGPPFFFWMKEKEEKNEMNVQSSDAAIKRLDCLSSIRMHESVCGSECMSAVSESARERDSVSGKLLGSRQGVCHYMSA